MGAIEVIETLEQLEKFLDDRGVIEIVRRGANKKYKEFVKITLNKASQEDAAEKLNTVIKSINKLTDMGNGAAKALDGIGKLGQLNLVLSGANLCATCAGFAIMYAKLDKMREQITEVLAAYKEGKTIETKFEFKKILSEHSDMLDCRKKQRYYTEKQLRELVDGEYNVLSMLIDAYLANITSNREELLFTILSLAQMLSVSIRYFDEVYYYNNKDNVGEGDHWHTSHDMWVSVYDALSSPSFIETIQDQGIFEIGLNTVENDGFFTSFYDQIKSLKQDIEDNQVMIETIDDQELFKVVMTKSNEVIQAKIESAFEEAGIPTEEFEEYIRAVAA